MEGESEAFAKAIVLSIKNQPLRAKKPLSKYQDSLDSLEDIRSSKEQLSSKFYVILVCIITDMYCVFNYKSKGLF